jgi:large subunit ribosomal protein L29
MNIKDLRSQNENELLKNLANLREQARDLRFRVHSKEVKNSHQLKDVKQNIARILTILNEKA